LLKKSKAPLLGSRLRFRVLAAEALNAACRIDQLLLAGEERVAGGADFYVDVALVGRASREIVAARAYNPDFVIVWMNTLLWHDSIKPFPAILLF
jgi:hypothetical protein